MKKKILTAVVALAVSAAAAGCSLPWAGRPEQAAAEGTQQAQEADTGDSGELIAQGEGEIWDDTDLYTDTEGEDGYEENISPDGTPVLPGEYTTGDCIKLCAIDGLEVTVPQKPDPEWEDAVVSAKFSMDAKPRSEDWAIEKGDMISADITAYIDGEKNEYLSRRDAQIFVGGDGSVKEFNDALIGARKGSDVEASVTYGEDYLYMDLGGKTVVYKIHVNAVNSADTPDDETVEKELEMLRRINAQVNEELLAQAVKAAIRDASEYTAYPEKMIRQARAEYERRYLAGYSSIEDYLNEVGMTRAEFKKIEDEYAAARVRDKLLLKALEEETGITADSPKFTAYAEEHGINNDDIGETQFKAICGDIKDRLSITVTEAEE